jgi:glycosyltransferase involved in cell wall biosynthesis
MIRIGIECEQLESPSWGIGRIISKFLQEIHRRPELRNEFEFCLYFKSRIPDLEFLKDPIFRKEIIWQPLPYKSFVLYYYVFLPIRLWFSRCDVMFFPNYMLPIIHFGKSLVLLTDDIYHEMRSAQQRFHHRLAYWVFGYWAVWRATRFMAISEASKKELVRLFGITSERITVNHLGVDTPRIEGEAPHSRPFILYVGQAFPRRHLKETLAAFERIAPEFPQLDFIIIGPDKYNPPIIEEAVQEINQRLGSPRVLHISHVADEMLARYYAHGAKALTYISSREAFGLPPMEALGHGSIPVLADLPLSHELFGDNAFFVPHPDSVESIAETLRDAVTNEPKRQKILEARESIMRKFTWKAHADRFIHIIRTMTHA